MSDDGLSPALTHRRADRMRLEHTHTTPTPIKRSTRYGGALKPGEKNYRTLNIVPPCFFYVLCAPSRPRPHHAASRNLAFFSIYGPEDSTCPQCETVFVLPAVTPEAKVAELALNILQAEVSDEVSKF